MPFDGFVSMNVVSADGAVVRHVLTSERWKRGRHEVSLNDAVAGLPAGVYSWRVLAHRGIGLRLRGWACNDGATPWPTSDGRGDWGGAGGVPSAVAADRQRVYLGWDRADAGRSVIAVDLEGRVQWGWRHPVLSGCKALAVDGGCVFVLAGMPAGKGADVIVRLKADDAGEAPWKGRPENEIAIPTLWPADAGAQPVQADAMSVHAGRIYLSFTEPGFIAVLDAQTGAYVTTLSGPQLGPMALSTTPMADPDAPGKMITADFGIVSIAQRAVSCFVMPHDPPWVAANTTHWFGDEDRITALAMRGDTMKTGDVQLFLGFDVPQQQVQARPASDPQGFTFSAGRVGGRVPGPWQPDALGPIRALAFDARQRLWIAEGDAHPPRFSVRTTEGKTGRLVREFFGPAEAGAPGSVIDPDNPDHLFAQGCEWRWDKKTGRARCVAVGTTPPAPRVSERFVIEPAETLQPGDGVACRELATGRVRWTFTPSKTVRLRVVGSAKLPPPLGEAWLLAADNGEWHLLSEDGVHVTKLFESDPQKIRWPKTAAPGADMSAVPSGSGLQGGSLVQTKDGRLFVQAGETAYWVLEVTGLDSARMLGSGRFDVAP
jgi:hypothetical protein